jgi:cholesterol oxidase
VLDGALTGNEVQSIICSQFFTHIDQNRVNQLKAFLHLGTLLQWVNVRPSMGSRVTTVSPFRYAIADRLLNFYPSKEQCRNAVCRRNLFLYGEVVRHDQLNQDTHDAMYDLFADGNLTSLRHLTRMIRARHVMPARGRTNPYLSKEAADRLTFPVTLIQGLDNGIFKPHGAERTLAWLDENWRHPDRESPHRLRRIPDYGHLDLFIGRNAWADVFPIIEQELERGRSTVAAAPRGPLLAAASGG